MQKLIIKNKLDRNEKIELTLDDFKLKFTSEIKRAIDSYKQSNKSTLPSFCKKDPTEEDFYFDIRYNFNSYANSNYYIDSIK